MMTTAVCFGNGVIMVTLIASARSSLAFVGLNACGGNSDEM
jgi:hypothetical protein